MAESKSIPKKEEVEKYEVLVRYRAGHEEMIEYQADTKVEPLRKGWLVLKAKSFRDPRKPDAPEQMSAVFVSRKKFPPGTEFQCHPDAAKILIELNQVDVIGK